MKNKNLLLIFLLAVAGFAVWYFKHIFIYIIIAAIIALIGQPIDRFYTKYLRFGKFKITPTLSAGLAFLTLFLVFFLLAVFFAPLVLEEAALLSSLDRDIILTSLQKPMENMDRLMHSMHIDYETANLQAYLQDKLISFFTVTNITLVINQFISALGDFFIAFFAISFLTFFFLRDENQVIARILSFVPEKYSEKAKKVWMECERLLKRYFIGVMIEASLVTTFLFIGLWIAGIKHALLIALFAGMMNVVPYVGPLIACAFALFIGLTTTADMTPLSLVIKILVIFPIVNLSDAFLLQPLIYSSSVKAHPLEIFLVILAGATIGGIGGMILAVPSYTILRVFVKEFFAGFRTSIWE
jgi:predicted PurR-regulated permease PerM